ncbi:hypothetical protein [Hyphomicrobium sp. ghe19]|uniref:hypothetical protein n=1 Tax=Hyphomicrobium sp. ghe19 TaxID=2682968 RepID=UPI001366AA19|nr:hypothetical protein HYPP_02467 [Hyphomicrobium sp. ghe19]
MALSFVKAGASKSAAASVPQSGFKKPSTPVGFLKKGAAAKEAFSNEEAKAEMAKAELGKMWRFRMQDGQDRRITFLDGDLDAEGMLDVNMFYEHTIRINGNWQNFICTAETDTSQPCPLCESGDRPSFVAVMTVIDHSEHTIEKGPNAGKVIKNQRRLFVCKRNTIKQLTKLAAKRGGLAGCTFDVSRTGEKEPAVGNQFDFVEKFESYDEIAAKYGLELDDVQPANYAEELKYRSPEELIELGVGKAIKSAIGAKSSSTGKLADHL